MKLGEYLYKNGYVEQVVNVCPNCEEVLEKDDLELVPAYHNTFDGVCKKCGHERHYIMFQQRVYVKTVKE